MTDEPSIEEQIDALSRAAFTPIEKVMAAQARIDAGLCPQTEPIPPGADQANPGGTRRDGNPATPTKGRITGS